MNPEEYNFDENLDLQVTTKDTTYSVLADDYYYANDTLHIKILKPLNERTNVKVKVNIPKAEIEKVEVTKKDESASNLTLIGVIVGNNGDWNSSWFSDDGTIGSEIKF